MSESPKKVNHEGSPGLGMIGGAAADLRICSRSIELSPQCVRVLYNKRITMDRAMSDGAPPRIDFTSLAEVKHGGDEVGRA